MSTEEQAREGFSLGAQEGRLRAYTAAAGLDMKKLIADPGVSGAKPLSARPGGRELLALTRSGVGNVVALKLDRLFRSTLDALQTIQEWDRAGVALHLVDFGGQALDTSSAMGRMMVTIMAALAELERSLTGERTAGVLRHKRAQLEAYGPTPFGYLRTGTALLADAGEQKELEFMRASREQGGCTYREIAAALNARGVPTKRSGGRWHAASVRRILEGAIHEQRHAA